MNLVDNMQLSLLDTGLTTDQIELVQKIIEEESTGMMIRLLSRFEEAGFTAKQMGLVLGNMFGFLVKEERVDEVVSDLNDVFGTGEET